MQQKYNKFVLRAILRKNSPTLIQIEKGQKQQNIFLNIKNSFDSDKRLKKEHT